MLPNLKSARFGSSTARTRIRVSLQVVRTQQWRMAGVAATSMRSTRGCGSLDVPHLGCLIIKETLDRHNATAKRQTRVGRRLIRVARVMVPDWKCSFGVICRSMY